MAPPARAASPGKPPPPDPHDRCFRRARDGDSRGGGPGAAPSPVRPLVPEVPVGWVRGGSCPPPP
eukprot:7406554-Alexandrium_andersonii.AAC.1